MLNIKKEFQELIPQLSPDEREELEESITTYGCRDGVVVWNGYIIDGHNRFDICRRNGILFQTVDMTYDFETEEEVKQWIIRNQFARRNLDKYQRSVLALQLKEMIAGKAKENQIASGVDYGRGGKVLMNSSKPLEDGITSQLSGQIDELKVPQISAEPIDTREELAKIAGVSHDTIHKVETIETQAPEPVRQAARDNVVSINKAYEITKAVRELPQDQQLDEATRLMNERRKATDKEIDRRSNLAESFAKAVEGIGLYHVTEEDLSCYIEASHRYLVDDLVKNCDHGIATLQQIKAMYTGLQKIRVVK